MSDSFYFPVFSGVLTKEHKDNMGSALWEFLWLISKTTKETIENGETIGIVLGGKPIKAAEIADDLGSSIRSTEGNISKLRKHGYITTKRTPYGNIFYVRKSKKFYKKRTAENGGSDDREPQEVAGLEGENRKNMGREPQKNVERTAESCGNKEDIKGYKGYKDIYVEIIDYLNQKTGKRFSPKSKANQKLINGRISEGRTLEDFKHVIDVKCDEWLNDEKMQRYLRPGTLFRPSNFENYLNQQPMTKTKKQSDPRDKEIEFQKWVSEGNDPSEFNWS